VEGRETRFWHEPGVFPGEPVFVRSPEGRAEDDGVLLSVTLDPARSTSFLLVLDARDLSELARAHVSQHIPWHFHGHFDPAPAGA
jgi:carotenoid cleavage dioxygenase-like enzyme